MCCSTTELVCLSNLVFDSIHETLVSFPLGCITGCLFGFLLDFETKRPPHLSWSTSNGPRRLLVFLLDYEEIRLTRPCLARLRNQDTVVDFLLDCNGHALFRSSSWFKSQTAVSYSFSAARTRRLPLSCPTANLRRSLSFLLDRCLFIFFRAYFETKTPFQLDFGTITPVPARMRS
jgi:hypothetical protein